MLCMIVRNGSRTACFTDTEVIIIHVLRLLAYEIGNAVNE
jgi:hypothetical protein